MEITNLTEKWGVSSSEDALPTNECSNRDQAGTSQFKKANPDMIPAQEMFLLAHAESWVFSQELSTAINQ